MSTDTFVSQDTDVPAGLKADSICCRSWSFLQLKVGRSSRGDLEIQQREALCDGDAVLVTQEVAAQRDDDGSPGEGEEALDPLCCDLNELHVRVRS